MKPEIAKVGVGGSNPLARSNVFNGLEDRQGIQRQAQQQEALETEVTAPSGDHHPTSTPVDMGQPV